MTRTASNVRKLAELDSAIQTIAQKFVVLNAALAQAHQAKRDALSLTATLRAYGELDDIHDKHRDLTETLRRLRISRTRTQQILAQKESRA